MDSATVAVRQVYQDHYRGVESGEKPALCVRGRKYAYCVVIDFPVRVLKRPARDFDTLRPTAYHGEEYPVDRMIKHLKTAGRRNGITKGALHLLMQAEAVKETELDEDDDSLTNEESAMQEVETTAGDAATLAADLAASIKATKKPRSAKKEKARQSALTEVRDATAAVDARKATTKPNGKAPGKKAAPAASKATKPATKTRAAAAKTKPAKKTAGAADGGPREGTVGRFIFDRVLAGDDNAKISAAAIKKFDNEKINVGYVSWWRNKLIKTGAIKQK